MRLFQKLGRKIRAAGKGTVGEWKVNRKLNPLVFGKVPHFQINNLILLDDMGSSHQIDHVEIRENGIFCIETKNYAGVILGTENQDRWTQCLRGKNHYTFLNPLKQNKSHIYHLSKALGGKYKIISLVVFVENNVDSLKIPNVIGLNDLKTYLRYYDDGTHYMLEEMQQIRDRIATLNAVWVTNRSHVENIKSTQERLAEGICPRCGGKLILRNGKYGDFFGCENYPKCKFTCKPE